jgi:hypothetical protein
MLGRGVRILKFCVRVSPWISTKDPRPQILTILGPQSVRVRNDCCSKFATFSYTLSALINSKSTIIGAMNEAAFSYLVQRNIAET